jgi:hypothetical protein
MKNYSTLLDCDALSLLVIPDVSMEPSAAITVLKTSPQQHRCDVATV